MRAKVPAVNAYHHPSALNQILYSLREKQKCAGKVIRGGAGCQRLVEVSGACRLQPPGGSQYRLMSATLLSNSARSTSRLRTAMSQKT